MAKTELEDDGIALDPVAETPPEPMNYRDEVANDVALALRQLKGETPEKIETPEEIGEPPADKADATEKPEKAAKAKSDKPRDPDTGKFAPKTESTEAPETAAPEQKSASPDIAAKASAPAVSTPQVAPPAGWTPDAKQAWAALTAVIPTLPPEVQASISAIQAAANKREQDISAGGRQWSEEKRQYETALAPIANAAKRHGISPAEGAQRLIAANDLLERDPQTGIMQLARAYGVDLATLVSNPPAPQPQRFVDPMVPQLNQKVSTLESQLEGFLQTQTLGVVESFAQSHPHYSAVDNELLELIPMVQRAEPGLPHSEVLQKAYDRAIWLNPSVRSAMLAEQNAAAEKANTEKAAEVEKQRIAAIQAKSTQSKKAAVSVKGSSTGAPAPAPKPTGNGTGDIYDDVRASIRQLKEAAM